MIFFYFFKNGRAVFSFDFALGGQEQVWCPLLGCELSAMKISSGFSGLESLGVLTGMLTFFDKHKVETAILDEYMSSKGLEPEEPQRCRSHQRLMNLTSNTYGQLMWVSSGRILL